MLPLGTPATCIQSSDIYIDMVKLTLWWWKPQIFISCLVFPVWNCNTAFTCILFFKCYVVLQHLRNSQGPLIFLQTLVSKLKTDSLCQFSLCPYWIILILHCSSLDCPYTVLYFKIPSWRYQWKDKERFLENSSCFFQEQLNLKLLSLLFSMKSHLKYFINAKRLAFRAKDQWTVAMATRKPFGTRKKMQ